MKYAKPEDCNIGDLIMVPINGEEWEDEQICQGYRVVKALKSVVPQSDQIVGDGQEPMPLLMEFTDETGFYTDINFDTL